MKFASIASISLFVFWVLVAILDMWFDLITWTVFVKLTITLALLIVLVLAVALVKREYLDDQQLRKDKYID